MIKFQELMARKDALNERLTAHGLRRFGHHQEPDEHALCTPDHRTYSEFIRILEVSISRIEAELLLLENGLP